MDICREQNIPILEKEIPKNTLGEYDSVFLTSTSSNVLPIVQIDQLTFRVDDPVVRLIIKEFNDLVEREIEKEGQRDRGTEGQRERGKEGQRERGTEGQRDRGIEG